MVGSRYLYFPVFVLLLGFFAVLTAKSELRGDRSTAALISVQRELGGLETDLAILETLPERRLLALVAKRLRAVFPETALYRGDFTAHLRVTVRDAEVFQAGTALLTDRGRSLVRTAVDLAGHHGEGLVLALSISGPGLMGGTEVGPLTEARLLALARVAWFRPAPRQWIRIGLDPNIREGLSLRFKAEVIGAEEATTDFIGKEGR